MVLYSLWSFWWGQSVSSIWWWPINHRTRLVLRLSSLGKRRKLFSFPWRPGKSIAHLFATKWVHIKHYGLEISGPNFWWDSASCFYFRKSGNHLNDVHNSRNVFFLEKTPAGQNRDNEDWRTELVYTWILISRCPDVQISRYQVSDTRYQVSGIRTKTWTSKKHIFPKS